MTHKNPIIDNFEEFTTSKPLTEGKMKANQWTQYDFFANGNLVWVIQLNGRFDKYQLKQEIQQLEKRFEQPITYTQKTFEK
jgi:hypothetical protein